LKLVRRRVAASAAQAQGPLDASRKLAYDSASGDRRRNGFVGVVSVGGEIEGWKARAKGRRAVVCWEAWSCPPVGRARRPRSLAGVMTNTVAVACSATKLPLQNTTGLQFSTNFVPSSDKLHLQTTIKYTRLFSVCREPYKATTL
jgi:hypothetical protein